MPKETTIISVNTYCISYAELIPIPGEYVVSSIVQHIIIRHTVPKSIKEIQEVLESIVGDKVMLKGISKLN